MNDGEEVANKDSDTGSPLSLVIGAAVGLSLGLVLGFLYAPRSGRKTRQLLKRKVMWTIMSPRERYAYLWEREGSLREWLQQQRDTSAVP